MSWIEWPLWKWFSEQINVIFPVVTFSCLIIWTFIDRLFNIALPIGTYIGIFALLGAIMTFFPPEGLWQKILWVLIFIVFLGFEFQTLYREERELNKQREIVADKFSKIITNLDRMVQESNWAREEERKRSAELLTRQETLFAHQEKLAKETLEKVKEREGALVPDNLPSVK
jgi:hypothetical protein